MKPELPTKISVITTPDGRKIDPELEECKFGNYVVAHLDILGASNIAEDAHILARVRRVFKILKIIYDEHNKDFDIKFFSDNILIAGQYADDPLVVINKIINITRGMQYLIMADCNLIFRGGITLGKLFISKDIVWGTALVDAVRLEEKIAIYPRIILSPEIAKKTDPSMIENCCRDKDGLFYVQMGADRWGEDSILDFLKQQKQAIIFGLANQDSHILEKMHWFKNEHNKLCEQQNHPELEI